MKFDEKDLLWAVETNLLTEEQRIRLIAEFKARHTDVAKLNGSNALYYLGALIVIGAMSFFMTLGFERFGAWGLFFISISYALLFCMTARSMLKVSLLIPGGLLVTMAVCMTPLAVYGLENGLGVWGGGSATRHYHQYYETINTHWMHLELATAIVSLFALRVVRFPFLVMPLAFSGWFFSMDVADALMHTPGNWQFHAKVSIWVGMLMLLLALWTDRKYVKDYAFWGYLFGLMAFWGGLSALHSDSELNKFIYCLINLGLIAVGVVLKRRAFLVFGGLGVAGYLGHLSYTIFKDSMGFSFALVAIGILTIWIGKAVHDAEDKIVAWSRAHLPSSILNALPPERD